MSPTNHRLTRDSGPLLISTSRIPTNLLERDCAILEPPPVEPLTPCTKDGYFPYDMSDLERAGFAVQSLLRLPLILDRILRITDRGEQLNEGLQLALGPRSAPERHQIRSFAQSLCHNCDNLYNIGPGLGNKDSDVRDNQNYKELGRGLRDQDDFSLKSTVEHSSAAEIYLPIEPANPTESEDGNIILGERKEVPSGDPQLCTDDDDVKQSTFQRTDPQHLQPIRIGRAKERSGPTSNALYMATSRPMMAGSDMLSRGAMASCTSASVAGTTLVASSPNAIPGVESVTPERTLTPISPRGASLSKQDKCEQDCLNLLGQGIDDFVNESLQQVRQLSLTGNSPEAYKAVFNSLGNKTSEAKDGVIRWSDGLEWVSLLEAGHGEQRKGVICYALTAIAFTRWHASQVLLVDGATSTQKATQKVSARILGPRPEGSGGYEAWGQRRKNLNTHLARGRKWSRLVEKLGYGILLKNTWELGKSKESALDTLIRDLPDSLAKIAILSLLADQMTLLLETGRTSPDKFHDDLESKGLLVSEPRSSTRCIEPDSFYKQLLDSNTSDTLLVMGTDFSFGVKSLQRLSPKSWFNDDIVLACLHVADKLTFVRVGFSIPIHRQKRVLGAIPRPFERAAKQMAEWNRPVEPQSPLVCFFPLFQHQNHFSLLEVNEREGYIYHYDPMGKEENGDVKAACEREFPKLLYIEKDTLRQSDSHSCGPLVVRFARHRMLGRPVRPAGGYNSDELRAEAITLLHMAWTSKALVIAPESPSRKRKDQAKDSGNQRVCGKRRKTNC